MARPTAELRFDQADCLGRIEKHGYGVDHVFQAKRQERANDEGTFAPTWQLNGCEIVPGLDLLGLVGKAPLYHMDTEDWSFLLPTPGGSNYWTTDTPEGLTEFVFFLSYVNAAPNERGFAVWNHMVQPRVGVYLVDFAPPPEQTQDVYTAIELRGENQVNYRLVLPRHGGALKYPTLYYHGGDFGGNGYTPVDANGNSTDWVEVDRCERVDLANQSATGGAVRRVVWLEETDGCLSIRMDGMSEPWVYVPSSALDATFTPTPGWVAIDFGGHAGLANVSEIEYGTSGTATPFEYPEFPEYIDPSATYKWAHSRHSNGTVAVEQRATGGPLITLTTPDVHNRPLVSVVHELHARTMSDPRTNAQNTQTRATEMIGYAKDPAELQSLWWRRTLGRGWEFGAGLRDPHAFWASYLKPNMECAPWVGWGSSKTQLMVGYLSSPDMARRANEEQGITAQINVHGRDFIAARMYGRKMMLWPCSPVTEKPELAASTGLWYLHEWAGWWLDRCAFPYDFTYPDTVLVGRQGRKEQEWAFDHRTQVHDGLDQVFRAHGWSELRTRTDGGLEAALTTEAYSGTPDFTLDESTATGDDLIEEVEVSAETDDIRNFVAAVYRGGVAVAYDESSIQDETAASFLGDVWMEVFGADDSEEPALQAVKRLIERMRTRKVVRWTRRLKADLPPGNTVAVTVSDVGVPAGTVMRVMQDEGRLQAGVMTPQSTFLCELLDASELL